MVCRLSIVVVVLVLFICTISFLLLSSSTTAAAAAAANSRSSAYGSQIKLEQLWRGAADSGDWRSSSVPRSHWPRMYSPPAPSESNGYLLVRCNGGLNQQRIGFDC